MSIKKSIKAKLYVCADGIAGTPNWTEVTTVKDLDHSSKADKADATSRANGGRKVNVATLIDDSIEFDIVWDSALPGFTALQNAFQNGTVIGVACMTSDITGGANGKSEGLWADCAVFQFDRSEKLGDVITAKVSLAPTYSANLPVWKVIGGS